MNRPQVFWFCTQCGKKLEKDACEEHPEARCDFYPTCEWEATRVGGIYEAQIGMGWVRIVPCKGGFNVYLMRDGIYHRQVKIPGLWGFSLSDALAKFHDHLRKHPAPAWARLTEPKVFQPVLLKYDERWNRRYCYDCRHSFGVKDPAHHCFGDVSGVVPDDFVDVSLNPRAVEFVAPCDFENGWYWFRFVRDQPEPDHWSVYHPTDEEPFGLRGRVYCASRGPRDLLKAYTDRWFGRDEQKTKTKKGTYQEEGAGDDESRICF